ncbi:MAG: hypothetical protein QXX55_01875 [Candidatus Pacearchaeota archaeon]
MIEKIKRGQLQISFGMIFSVILIIIFLVFGFYAIKTFFNVGTSASTVKFISELQNDIDRIWKSTESSEKKEYYLSSRISYVCFVDFSVPARGENIEFYTNLRRGYYGEENMIFYPFGSSEVESAKIKNIDMEYIIQTNNPYCVKNEGKISFILSKDYGEALVKIR